MSYYLGPYDVRVPDDIKTIYAPDGMNRGSYVTNKDGTRTFMATQLWATNPMSEQEYKNAYCIQHDDGTWWYNPLLASQKMNSDSNTIVSANNTIVVPNTLHFDSNLIPTVVTYNTLSTNILSTNIENWSSPNIRTDVTTDEEKIQKILNELNKSMGLSESNVPYTENNVVDTIGTDNTREYGLSNVPYNKNNVVDTIGTDNTTKTNTVEYSNSKNNLEFSELDAAYSDVSSGAGISPWMQSTRMYPYPSNDLRDAPKNIPTVTASPPTSTVVPPEHVLSTPEHVLSTPEHVLSTIETKLSKDTIAMAALLLLAQGAIMSLPWGILLGIMFNKYF